MKYFEKYRQIIETYSDDNKIKPLDKCTETMNLLEKESSVANPYRLLAYKFLWYEKGGSDKTGDYYFYKYLTSCNGKYTFPMSNDDSITIEMDLLNPFYDKDNGIINPKWHLFVSLLAYIDSAFNHDDNGDAEKIKSKNNWTERYKHVIIRNKVLKVWMEEAKIE